MKKTIFIIVIVILLIFGFYYFNKVNTRSDITQEQEVEEIETEHKTYQDTDTGLSFQYLVSPRGYTLVEHSKNQNDSDDFVKGITLFRTTDYEDMLSGPDRGGPPSINIRIFDNSDSNLDTWLENNRLLTNDQGLQKSIEIDGMKGIHYTWEGMFDGETIVVHDDDYVYMIESTYHTETEDTRQQEFKDLLDSISID